MRTDRGAVVLFGCVVLSLPGCYGILGGENGRKAVTESARSKRGRGCGRKNAERRGDGEGLGHTAAAPTDKAPADVVEGGRARARGRRGLLRRGDRDGGRRRAPRGTGRVAGRCRRRSGPSRRRGGRSGPAARHGVGVGARGARRGAGGARWGVRHGGRQPLRRLGGPACRRPVRGARRGRGARGVPQRGLQRRLRRVRFRLPARPWLQRRRSLLLGEHHQGAVRHVRGPGPGRRGRGGARRRGLRGHGHGGHGHHGLRRPEHLRPGHGAHGYHRLLRQHRLCAAPQPIQRGLRGVGGGGRRGRCGLGWRVVSLLHAARAGETLAWCGRVP